MPSHRASADELRDPDRRAQFARRTASRRASASLLAWLLAVAVAAVLGAVLGLVVGVLILDLPALPVIALPAVAGALVVVADRIRSRRLARHRDEGS